MPDIDDHDSGPGSLETYEMWPAPLQLPEARETAHSVHESDWPGDSAPWAYGV
ncbi:hypothetical protein [Streptomyces sp. SCL15-4]|uniref:hypothetical protein n=1 Tax=Streptomyces sp. SCL15-4 TaxID=2967221 RepID=UPI0029662C63|nr:hypothetical protein [Streptomyces sp. SCL15-4]